MGGMRASTMQVYVCGTGLKAAVFINGLLDRQVSVAKVFSYDQKDDRSKSFDHIVAICGSRSIPITEDHRPSLVEFQGADLIFLVGWQYLFPFSDPRFIVFHDSLLPRYRGFSPTVTALIAGDDVLGVTAFHAADSADNGPILAQARLSVHPPARIDEVLRRQAELMVDLAVNLLATKAVGEFNPQQQDEGQATYSHWRDAEDYFIDWAWPAKKIQRAVYALGYPYEGARTILEDRVAIIVDCEVLPDDLTFAVRQPGKVWRLTDRGPLVVCGSGLLRVLTIRTVTGAEILLSKLRTRFRNFTRTDCLDRAAP
jgi:methionyl-tRNA formyltransferase